MLDFGQVLQRSSAMSLLLFLFLATLRTDALGHVIDVCQLIAWGELYRRNRSVGQAKCAMAALTVEMHMLVVIMLMAVVAEA